jgi:hypothetical protein
MGSRLPQRVSGAPGLTTMVNSMVNGWRMEDVWLDR